MPADLITQRELQQYRDKKTEAGNATASEEVLKELLQERLAAGAEVEPGKLIAHIVKGSQGKRFSFKEVVRLLGLPKAEKLKADLPESTYESLKVDEIA
jgi:hypothetical protein